MGIFLLMQQERYDKNCKGMENKVHLQFAAGQTAARWGVRRLFGHGRVTDSDDNLSKGLKHPVHRPCHLETQAAGSAK